MADLEWERHQKNFSEWQNNVAALYKLFSKNKNDEPLSKCDQIRKQQENTKLYQESLKLFDKMKYENGYYEYLLEHFVEMKNDNLKDEKTEPDVKRRRNLNLDVFTCDLCGFKSDNQTNNDLNVCLQCGLTDKDRLVSNIEFEETSKVHKIVPYCRPVYGRELLKQIQGKTRVVIPECLLDDLIQKKSTAETIWNDLNELGFDQFHTEIPKILYLLNGKNGRLDISYDVEQYLNKRLVEVTEKFQRLKMKNGTVMGRKSIISYQFMYHKLCEEIGETRIKWKVTKKTQLLKKYEQIWNLIK